MPKNTWPRQIGLLVLLGIMILFALTSLIIFSGGTHVSAAQQGTIVTLTSDEQAFTDELITVKLVANNAHNLAGYQGTIHYDASSNLLFMGAISEKGLSLSGRDIIPLETVSHEGVVILGAVTCPVADCGDSQYDSAPRFLQGVDGYVELASLEFIAEAPGPHELILENVQLVDPQGNQLGATTANVVLDVNTK